MIFFLTKFFDQQIYFRPKIYFTIWSSEEININMKSFNQFDSDDNETDTEEESESDTEVPINDNQDLLEINPLYRSEAGGFIYVGGDLVSRRFYTMDSCC